MDISGSNRLIKDINAVVGVVGGVMNKITAKQGETAFGLHQKILELKEQMGVRFLTMGKLLKELKDKEYFKVLGYDTFTSYVINSEIGFKRSTAFGYIELYNWFVERLGFSVQRIGHLSLNEMNRVLSVLKKEFNESEKYPFRQLKERSTELVSEVKDLRPVDFNKKYKDEKKQEGFEDHLAPPEYFRCSKCGKWIFVVPIQDCCPDFLAKFKKMLDKRKTTN